MLSLQDQIDIASKSMEALKRIQSAKSEKLKLEDNSWRKPNYSKLVFEEYSEESFSDKIKRDTAYYNVLLKRLDESQSDNIHHILGSMMNVVKSIYEQINIKPKVYGLVRLPSLDETDSVIEEHANCIISDFINRNYYSLTKDQRERKYEEAVKLTASSLIINESIDPREAVRFATKVSVVESLLEQISFPSTISHEIKNYISSKEYNEFFEQSTLIDLWDEFKTMSRGLSKIIASVV